MWMTCGRAMPPIAARPRVEAARMPIGGPQPRPALVHPFANCIPCSGHCGAMAARSRSLAEGCSLRSQGPSARLRACKGERWRSHRRAEASRSGGPQFWQTCVPRKLQPEQSIACMCGGPSTAASGRADSTSQTSAGRSFAPRRPATLASACAPQAATRVLKRQGEVKSRAAPLEMPFHRRRRSESTPRKCSRGLRSRSNPPHALFHPPRRTFSPLFYYICRG